MIYNSTWLIAIVIIIMPPNAVLDYVIIPKYIIINSVAQTQALYAIWLRILKIIQYNIYNYHSLKTRT